MPGVITNPRKQMTNAQEAKLAPIADELRHFVEQNDDLRETRAWDLIRDGLFAIDQALALHYHQD